MMPIYSFFAWRPPTFAVVTQSEAQSNHQILHERGSANLLAYGSASILLQLTQKMGDKRRCIDVCCLPSHTLGKSSSECAKGF
jgi:hypothetical protein